MQAIEQETEKKMKQSVEKLRQDLLGLRSGRASADFLRGLQAEVYGTRMPLEQLATVTAPEVRLLLVTPFDPSQAAAIEKAIAQADLGLNPAREGNLIRVPIPSMSEEHRQALVKRLRKLAEEGRVAVRNLRREANSRVQKLEKAKDISQDDARQFGVRIQKLTDAHIAQIDRFTEQKAKALMEV